MISSGGTPSASTTKRSSKKSACEISTAAMVEALHNASDKNGPTPILKKKKMKSICPRCQSEISHKYSECGHEIRCNVCGHLFVACDPPPLQPVPIAWRICRNCLTIAEPTRRQPVWAIGCMAVFLMVLGGIIMQGLFGLVGVVIYCAVVLAGLIQIALAPDLACPECKAPNMVGQNSPEGKTLVEEKGLSLLLPPE